MDAFQYHYFTSLLDIVYRTGTVLYHRISLVILHMNFYRCMCTRVYIHRGVHIRLFMTLRDVWLHIQASFPTCNDDYTVIASSSDKSFIVLVKYCKVIIVTPHPITPAGRCLHPPNGAIGVSKRLKGPSGPARS